jgi:hypothetical protein
LSFGWTYPDCVSHAQLGDCPVAKRKPATYDESRGRHQLAAPMPVIDRIFAAPRENVEGKN